jgi:DNA-binding MurR/RpiR family transcriptional regulator
LTEVAGTIEDQIRLAFDGLTRAERQLANHVTRNYPVAALGSITALAKGAEVSTPTVVRMVQKLGYRGYPDFQSKVRGEVEDRLITPLAKHDRRAAGREDKHLLTRYADAVIGNLEATLGQIDRAEFDAVAALMADPARRVFATGGRITHAMADYFVTHMTIMRTGVTLMPDRSNAWPPAMLDMRAGDVLLAFDIRRYENTVLQLVELAADQGADVVLVTDQWVSPASARAWHRLIAHVEAPSAWDSMAVIQVLIETLLAAVQGLVWDETQVRMKRLEEIYARTKFFKWSK